MRTDRSLSVTPVITLKTSCRHPNYKIHFGPFSILIKEYNKQKTANVVRTKQII